MRACAALVLGGLLSGCFELDPFLYAPERVEGYSLPAEGETPEETVDPSQIEPVWIVVNAEVTLGAAYIRASVQPPRGYLLYFRGQGGNLDGTLPRAKRLANLGYDVLTFDYRGWGASSAVRPTEAGIVEDAAAAQAWLAARVGGPVFGYYARSFGTAVATELSTRLPPPALVLESPFASIQGFVEDSSGGMDLPASFVAASRWNTEGRIAEVRAPLLILHGTADDYVRPQFSERIFQRANEPKTLVRIEGADHGNVPEVMGPAYGETLQAFYGANLP